MKTSHNSHSDKENIKQSLLIYSVPGKEISGQLLDSETLKRIQKEQEEKRRSRRVKKEKRIEKQKKRFVKSARKRRRKPRFEPILFRYVAVCEIICLALATIGTIFYGYVTYSRAKSDAEQQFYKIREQIQSGEKPAVVLRQGADEFAGSENIFGSETRAFATRFIEKQDYDSVLGKSDLVLKFDIFSVEAGETLTYCIEMDEHPELLDVILSEQKKWKRSQADPNSEKVYFSVSVEDFYLDANGKCYPGVVSIYMKEVSTGEVEVNSNNYFYGNKTNMTYCKVDGVHYRDVKGPYNNAVLTGNCSDSSAEKQIEEKYKSFLENNTKESGLGYCILGEFHLFKECTFQFADTIFTDSGQQLIVTSLATVNTWKESRMLYILAWIGMLAIPALLCSWLAYMSYFKELFLYEIESYRRKTTNAMAHDLKSPLMVISGYAENLLEEEEESVKYHYMKEIQNKIGYMNGLIEDILQLSKMEQTVLVLDLEEMEIGSCLETIFLEQNGLMKKKHLDFVIQGELVIKADRRLFYRLLNNLVQNAVKYALENSTITVVLEQEYHHLGGRISIKNASEPLSLEFCRKAFEPFVKGDTARGGQNGSGIGLSIVKEICDAHLMSCYMESDEESVTVTVVI